MTLSVVGGEARMPVHSSKRIRSGAWGRWHNSGGKENNKKAPEGAFDQAGMSGQVMSGAVDKSSRFKATR